MDQVERPVLITRIVASLIIGFVIGLVVFIVVIVWWAKEDHPPLSHDALQSAMSRWQAKGLDNYDLEVQLQGRRNDLIRLNVRAGEPRSLTINGNPIQRPRSWEAWTVEGQFDIIQTDWRASHDEADGREMVLRARFDPKLGYPLVYLNIQLGRNLETGWKLLDFRAVDARN